MTTAGTLLPIGANEPHIDGYRLLARYPSGATNTTYVGLEQHAVRGPRQAVVKLVPRTADRYQQRKQELFDEARVLSFLTHPNIVRLINAREVEAGTYLACEHVDGMDFRVLLRWFETNGERLTIEQSVFVVIEVLRALDHVHSAVGPHGVPLQIVHRDVNPANILIARTGHVYLADFGMVKMMGRDQSPTLPGKVKGKARFLAPEYIAEQVAGPVVDIYGAGVTLFEALLGGPWTLETNTVSLMRQIIHDGLPLAALARVGVPDTLVEIVAKATHADERLRYQRANDLAYALAGWLSERGTRFGPSSLARAVARAMTVC